jgi:hypothetical protein
LVCSLAILAEAVGAILCAFQKMEVSPGSMHVAGYLFAQRFHRGKLDLVTQALQEIDLHFRVGREFDGVEIQQVAFDRE